MIACPSCGADNVEGTRFCVKCGTTLPTAPAPESWRQSGDLGQQQQTQQPGYQSGGYTPPQTPPSQYPTYNPPQANVGAAIHSWDEAAKASGGQFQPILFK